MATGNGKPSNLGASSSTKTAKQEEKRKQCATATRAASFPAHQRQAKKQRPFQLNNVSARPRGSGTAVPFSNMATTAFPFPMAGVNGAAPLWSTAATLGAASRAAALALSSLPAKAGANGAGANPFVLAPAPGLQPPAGAAATNAAAVAALALPAASSATAVRPPLVLAQAGAAGQGQLVSLPLHFVGYHPTYRASGLPAPAVGIPLAAALDKIENGALGRMLSALMPACHPPLRQHQSKTGTPPPWWPTGSEHWWVPELLAHLDTVAALQAPVPFASSYSLKKAQKVAVLVAIVKHLAPDFARISAAVRHSGKLSVSETNLWHSALNNERAKCMRPVFILLPPQQQQGGGGGGGGSASTPSAAGSVVVHSDSGNGASDGREQVANLPAGASAPAPAAAGDDRDDQPVNFTAAGDDGTHKQGAAAVAAPAGHVRQVAAEPEMMRQPEQHGGIIQGNDVAAAEDDQAHPVVAHPVVVDADAPNPNAVAEIEVAPDGRHWWCNNEELNRMFAEFESFGDVWY